MRPERIVGISIHRIPAPPFSSSSSSVFGRLTRTRLLPLLLLLAIVVGTLVVITLSQMAVMHRFAAGTIPSIVQQQPSLTLGRPSSSATATVVAAVAAAPLPVSGSSEAASDKPFKLEPLISRSVTPVEVHALHLRNVANEHRVAVIVRKATAAAAALSGDSTLSATMNETRDSSSSSFDEDQQLRLADNSDCAKTELLFRPYCPQVPPDLIGELHADNVTHSTDVTMEDVLADNSEVCPGGWWTPQVSTAMTSPCLARHRVAIIVPYRDRQAHLITLLSHLHPILQRQQIHYQIFVTEQTSNGTFNKGILMNAAFEIAMREGHFQCFVFHDVDLIPEDDRNMYSCPPIPRHMSVGVDEFKYILPYYDLIGGVFSIRTEHFLEVNGYSNMYWGWGGEDDDMSYRLSHVGLSITRPSVTVARYRMIKHIKRKPLVWKIRGKLLNTAKKRMKYDGLNSLKYTLASRESHPLYTNITIDVGVCPPTICAP